MKKQISALNLTENSKESVYVTLASSCPICGVSLSPSVLYAALVDIESNDDFFEEIRTLYVLNYCPSCEKCFISNHTCYGSIDDFDYDSSFPAVFNENKFSENISNLSPDFVKIYNQALCAETYGLDSICGVGYRKSLEFLVKDYAISTNPDKKELIISTPLSKCISTYIQDRRLCSLATASAWLGNDETHYSKKHPAYNFENLKKFINAFVTFIDSELSYQEAQSLISPL